MYTFLLIVGGILALGYGAEIIVRSSINLANYYNVSGYFIGFTLIALGTSLPELAATLQALSIVNSFEIAVGNIIGSNIANILLILGVVSVINPIYLSEKIGQKNQTLIVLVLTLFATLIFIFISNFDVIDSRIFGIFLVIVFLFFLLFQYKNELNDNATNTNEPKNSQLVSYFLLIVGLVMLYYGSKYFIIGAEKFAYNLKIPESIIGLTLVAFGTSLPELATGIVAASKKQTNLAIGTILGSNIYNIVGIFALILFLKPNSFPFNSLVLSINIMIMTIVTIVFVYKVRFGLSILNIKPFYLGKKSGIIFLLSYAIYIFYNYL